LASRSHSDLQRFRLPTDVRSLGLQTDMQSFEAQTDVCRLRLLNDLHSFKLQTDLRHFRSQTDLRSFRLITDLCSLRSATGSRCYESETESRSPCPHRSIILLCLAFLVLACDESLPPLVEPANVLSTTLQLQLGANNYVIMTGGTEPLGTDGAVDVKITNLYTEVLSDAEMIRVQAVIYQTSHPERRDTVYGDRNDVQNPSLLLGNLVAIPPGKQLEVLTQWSHAFNGVPFWKMADSKTTIAVSGMIDTLYRVQFTVNARVQVFKTRPVQVVGDQTFTVFYRLSK
jgi:hypothetical protein